MEINNYWVVGLPIDIDTDINIDMLSAVEKFKRATYIRENPKRFLNQLPLPKGRGLLNEQ